MALNRSPSLQGVDQFFSNALLEESAVTFLHYIQQTGWSIPDQAVDFEVYFSNLTYLIGLVRTDYPFCEKERQLMLAKQLATKLSVVFSSHASTIKYIDRCKKHEKNQGVMECAGLFSLPETNRWDVVAWRKIIEKHRPNSAKDKIMRLISWLDKLERYIRSQSLEDIYQHIDRDYTNRFSRTLSGDALHHQMDATKSERRSKGQVDKWKFGDKLSFSALKYYEMCIKYHRVNENKFAANLFLKFNRTEKSFDEYLDLIPAVKKNLPTIFFNGSLINKRYKSYFMETIAADNPVAAVLGRLSSCCQSMGDDGEDVAIHGITSPNGSFYALYHEKSGDKKELIAQCWAWISKERYVVLDSIEVNRNHLIPDLSVLIADFFKHLAYELVVHHQVGRVLLGVDRWVPSTFSRLLMACEPVDYHGYRDSLAQVIIADSQIPIICLNSDSEDKSSYFLYSYMQFIDMDIRYEVIYKWCNLSLLSRLDRGYFNQNILPYAGFLGLNKSKVIEYIELHFSCLGMLEIMYKILMNSSKSDAVTSGFLAEKKHISNYIYENYSRGINKQLNVEGYSFFKLLVGLGWWDVLDGLVERGISLNRKYFDEEDFVLHAAVKSGQEQFVAAYAKCNPEDISNTDYSNETALHVAAKINHLNLVILLLDLGINVRIKSNDRFAFELTDSDAVCAYILNYHTIDDKVDALFRAAKVGNVRLISFLLSHGVSKVKTNSKGCSILHVAIENANFDLAANLIDRHHLSLEMPDSRGVTPWQLLYQHDMMNVLFFLADLSPATVKKSINSQDINGETLLHVAARENCSCLVDHLVLYGADIALSNNRNLMPKQLTNDRKTKQAMLLKAGGRTSPNLFHSPSDVNRQSKKAVPRLKRRITK